jgi:hypothetical protein
MTQDNQQDPIEETGGYGTPTPEQELPAADQPNAADQQNSAEPGAGSFGGTEEQMSSENANARTGYDADPEASADAGTAVPSSEADMDGANTEQPDAGRPFSSEPGQDAAGLPDGSGTDLPASKSPKDSDDDADAFDAG